VFVKIILSIGLWIFGFVSAQAATVAASLDADNYYATQTYKSVRTGVRDAGTFNVGVSILNANPNYDTHFNFAGIEFSDLRSLTTQGSKFLQLNLKDFKTPGAIVPGYQGPPPYNYLTTGSFQLAVVALGANFAESEIALLSTWYQNNLFGRDRVATVTFSQAGQVEIDVTSTVNDWIINPATNFGFGLVGIDSTPYATTAQFYSMEAPENLRPVLIPEPAVGSLLAFGFAVALANRRRRRS
jgi:hypothetical protein